MKNPNSKAGPVSGEGKGTFWTNPSQLPTIILIVHHDGDEIKEGGDLEGGCRG